MKNVENKRKLLIIGGCVLSLAVIVSFAINIYFLFFNYDSYLQSTDEIYVMEAGILNNNIQFMKGEDHEFVYDFDNELYAQLKSKYNIEKIAGERTELQKSLRLMDEFSSRLKHKSNYDNHIEMNAVSLLEYSLDNRNHGINCRSKAQILNEMCLALNIYARKVWIMPNSKYDGDCHVVNEIWDSELNKWIMLDITNNEYWCDENGVPLSVLEIRYKGAKCEFCTPVRANEKLNDLSKLKKKHINDFVYIMKNMVYMEYCESYSIGECDKIYLLFPANIQTKYEFIISEESVKRSPVKN